MLRKIGLFFLVVSFLVTGCMPVPGQLEPAATQPAPGEEVPSSGDKPVTSETPASGSARSPLEPLPNEDKFTRGEVFVEGTSIQVLESSPVQIVLVVSGTLPTPCHQLRMEMKSPDAQNRIDLELYTLVDPEMMCVQMLEFFEESINLGSFPSGDYDIYLNGEMVGEFTS
jgi:hypothetical protein